MRFIFPQISIKIERWKWNQEFKVYVSNYGNFRDINKKPIPIKIDEDGYIIVNKTKAHRIVMMTWKPIENAHKLTVDHLNHNKRNNAISNLEWVTKEENQRRAVRDSNYAESEKLHEVVYCITTGKKFKNSHEAAKWLMKTDIFAMDTNRKDSINMEYVAKRIRQSGIRNKYYYNYEWTYDKELFEKRKLLAKPEKVLRSSTTGKRTFKDVDEATDYFMLHNREFLVATRKKSVNKEDVKRRIASCAKSGTSSYYGVKWFWVETCGDQVGSTN